MKSCDGTGHQGYRKEPIQYMGRSLYFRGHNTTKGLLNQLDKAHSIFTIATHIVVTGQSAGGLATFLWSNYIASRAPKDAKIWALPDSGIFLDYPHYITKEN